MFSKQKNLKMIIIIISCAMVLLISTILIVAYNIKAPKPYETFEAYKESWEKQDFKTMYSLLSSETKSKIKEEDFVKKYETIYKGIEANNLKIEADDGEDSKKVQGENADVSFSVVMDTLAGNVEIPQYNMNLIEEEVDNKKTWTVVWDEKLVFPELGPNDKVKATTINPKRGEISDKNGKGLAINGTLNTIIIVPSKFNAVKDKALPEIAQILDISQDKISKLLSSSTNPDWAVPIVTLSTEDREKATKLTAIDGVQYQKSQGRVYPGGEAFGSLIGYIAPITAEEMDNHKDEGYTSQDMIQIYIQHTFQTLHVMHGRVQQKIHLLIDLKQLMHQVLLLNSAQEQLD